MRHNIPFWLKRMTAYLLITAAMPVNAVQIREVPVLHLQDVSIATYDKFGPVIYYNPSALQILGPQISKFVRAHEYAHHILHHIERGNRSASQISVAEQRRAFELEADCYAAQKVSWRVALAAANNLSQTQGLKRADAHHPSGNERATVIRQCAGISS